MGDVVAAAVGHKHRDVGCKTELVERLHQESAMAPNRHPEKQSPRAGSGAVSAGTSQGTLLHGGLGRSGRWLDLMGTHPMEKPTSDLDQRHAAGPSCGQELVVMVVKARSAKEMEGGSVAAPGWLPRSRFTQRKDETVGSC